MTLPLVFRSIAQAEFDKSAAWYESQEPGLGSDFVDKVQQVIDVIIEHPDRYPIVFGDVREAILSRYPFCIYYRVKKDRLVVISVFHNSRDPSIWQGRK